MIIHWSLLNRIKKYLDFKGVSVSAFERSIDMSNGLVNRAIKRGGSISSDNIEKFFRTYPDANPEWIILGKGSMLRVTEINEPVAASSDEKEVQTTKEPNTSDFLRRFEELAVENALLKAELTKYKERDRS